MANVENRRSLSEPLIPPRGEIISIAVFVLLALAVRLLALQYQDVVSEDGAHYLILAKRLVNGNYREGFSTYWSPLYPLLAGLASVVFRDLELGARLVSVISGALLVVPFYLLVREFYGKDAARVAASLIVVYPSLIQYSVLVMTEATYILLFTSGILAGWVALSRLQRGAFALTGILFAACYLVRPEAICFLGLMAALSIGLGLFQRIPPSKLLPGIAALLLGFAIVSAPYLFYLRQQTGRWMISEKMQVHLPAALSGGSQSSGDFSWKKSWLRLSEDGETTLADRFWGDKRTKDESFGDFQQTGGRTLTLSNFAYSLRVLVYYLQILPNIFPLPLVLLFGLGFLRTRSSLREWAKDAYIFAYLSATLLGYAFLHLPVLRYLVPLIPLLVPWTAVGVVELGRRLALLARKLWRHEAPALCAARPLTIIISAWVVMYLLVSAVRLYTPTQRLKLQSLELKPVIAWMREQAGSSPRIMATGPIIPFYVNGEHIYLPDEEFPIVLDYARRKNIRYIVVERRNVNKVKNTTLQFLLHDENQPPSGLKLAYKNDQLARHKVVVYELTN